MDADIRARARERIESGSGAEALALLEVGAEQLAARRDAAGAVRLLADAAQVGLLVHGPGRAVSIAEQAVRVATPVGGAELQRATLRLGDALSWAGRYGEARSAWLRAAVDPGHEDPELLAERANALLRLGDPDAHDAAFRALVAARAQGDRPGMLDALGLVAVAEVRAGRLQEALGIAEQFLDLVAGAGSMDEFDGHALLAWVLALLGDAARCREAIGQAERGLAARRQTASGGLARGLLALSLGSAAEAIAAFESKLAGQRFGSVAAMTALRPFAAELIEAYARGQRIEAGRRVLAACLPVALGAAQPRLVAPMRRGQGILEDDEDAFRHALDAHAGWSNMFELGRTHLAFGELLRRQRRRAEARDQLERAVASFERVGSVLWLARAHAELRLAGERLPARRPVGAASVEPLTRQEGEVLELVRAGLSNREIAERLVLSVKTVEGHLTTIYGKLGVASRAQALAALGRGAAVDEPA